MTNQVRQSKSKPATTLVLLDAHAILHRAYHALPDFTSSRGEPTGCLYGLTAMLLKIIADWQPDYLVAAYDLPEPTFRRQVYDNYKAGRPKADDELVAQIKRSYDLLAAFNIPVYQAAGFEADDIIGTIVKQLQDQTKLKIIIASGDMDTMQLVDDDQVVVYTLKRGINDTVLYNQAAVRDRFGFEPKFLVDFKGLSGDPSDNIIGVPGIGVKTATQLITAFGRIEDIYKILNQNPDKFSAAGFKPRIAKLLLEHKDEALFSKTLATIRTDAPIDFKLPKTTWLAGFDLSAAKNLLAELEFKSLNSRLTELIARLTNNHQPPSSTQTETSVNQTDLIEAAIGLWLLNSDYTQAGLEDVLNFAGTKDLTQAKQYIFKELAAADLIKVWQEIEQPLIPIIRQAEQRGILIDRQYLTKLSSKYHRQLSQLAKKIHQQAGREFNINSPKQLGQVLFTDLGLSTKGVKKTAGGALSTRESVLEKLQDQHPIIKNILAHRELQKILSTYIDAIINKLDDNNRLHTHLHQSGTTTGRMSSTDPNLQNIPAREGPGLAIRQAFVATPGQVWLAIDYSQIEMRVLAELSGDPALIEIFQSNKDVHSSVAALVFGVPEDQVTKDMRRQAKVINFGIIYGMGVNALKDNLNSTRAEAQKFYDDYFNTLPTIRQYFDEVVAEAKQRGYTETKFGRRRYFRGLHSPLPQIKAAAERQAYNAPLQGTAADIVKLATIAADQAINQAGFSNQVHFLLQVHDELIYEVEAQITDQVVPIIKTAAEEVMTGRVPLKVEVMTGPNWGQLKSYS